MQKIIKKSSKINVKSMEIEAWTGLGGSWGRLGSHLGSQGRLARNKGARLPKNDHVWAPILGSIFEIFRYFSMFVLHSFSSLHFDGYQDRFFMDFDHFCGLLLGALFMSFRIVGK